MLTEKDYCDYDTCVALKELGYPTKMTFVNEFGSIEIPINSGLIQLYEAQKWLRDEKRIHIVLTYHSQIGWYEYSVEKDDNLIAGGSAFPTYEDALSTAIYMAVEHLKEESNGN